MRVAAVSLLLWLAAASAAAAKPLVLVELFTSQGCESCAQANAFVSELAERDGVLPLTFSVNYLDYLGWRDTFARPEFGDRQKSYVRRLTTRAVYAPQVVVDGRAQASAAKPAAVEKLVDEARHAPRNAPEMLVRQDGRIAVGSGPAPKGGADVWLIRYDPRPQAVEVTSGENRGKTVPYRNVVQELVRLGSWEGRPKLYRAPAAGADGLETVIVLQQAGGGKILGALAE